MKIEQETVDAILKYKKIDFTEEYYKVSHFPQTTKQIQENKKKRLWTIWKLLLNFILGT